MLRVIEISKTPISAIYPELDYSSSAVVMLYDWVGDEMPAAETAEGLSFKPIVTEFWQAPKKVVSAMCLESAGTKNDKKWAEITRIKQDKNFTTPEIYTQHRCTPIEFIDSFNISMVFTFAIDEDEETEWYSDEHFGEGR